ncbi:hypothetical protein TNCV_4194161 [Trichonephila clavipes]|nr:hypothetical protein TNCV_4194161 [Trichonephila clavipes]
MLHEQIDFLEYVLSVSRIFAVATDMRATRSLALATDYRTPCFSSPKVNWKNLVSVEGNKLSHHNQSIKLQSTKSIKLCWSAIILKSRSLKNNSRNLVLKIW